jgi:hypothetical protein
MQNNSRNYKIYDTVFCRPAAVCLETVHASPSTPKSSFDRCCAQLSAKIDLTPARRANTHPAMLPQCSAPRSETAKIVSVGLDAPSVGKMHGPVRPTPFGRGFDRRQYLDQPNLLLCSRWRGQKRRDRGAIEECGADDEQSFNTSRCPDLCRRRP